MKTRLSSIMNTRKKKAGVLVICLVLIAIIGAGISKPLESTPVLEQTKDSRVQTEPIDHVPVESGGIQTSDGKNLSIWMGAGRDNNFAKMAWEKGEPIIFSVESKEKSELEIGIMSVSTDKVYSETVTTGTGTVSITVPEDGDYRIYIKNHAKSVAHFQLKLNKKLEGPLV